jgi:hypothetical protein
MTEIEQAEAVVAGFNVCVNCQRRPAILLKGCIHCWRGALPFIKVLDRDEVRQTVDIKIDSHRINAVPQYIWDEING